MSKLLKEKWDKLAFSKGNKSLNESEDIYPRPQHPMIAAGQAQALEQAELEDALFECLCDWLVRSPNPSRAGGDTFEDFVEEIAKRLNLDRASLVDQLEDAMFR